MAHESEINIYTYTISCGILVTVDVDYVFLQLI